MEVHVLSLFPEIIQPWFSTSLLGRASQSGKVHFSVDNPREYTENLHRQVDDSPYGGGPGMVLMAEPFFKAWKATAKPESVTIVTSPAGIPFTQEFAKKLSEKEQIILICGHYEGFDQRLIDETQAVPVSIGDYVLTGGELPALVIIDAVVRLILGVVGNPESLCEESFSHTSLLEYYHYTRPQVWRDRTVPPVLLSGHHKNIQVHRHVESLYTTWRFRPDVLKQYGLTKEESTMLLKRIISEIEQAVR